MQAFIAEVPEDSIAVPAPSGFLDFAPTRGECEIVRRRCARNDKSQTVSLRLQPLQVSGPSRAVKGERKIFSALP